jgi:hypothetical protein
MGGKWVSRGRGFSLWRCLPVMALAVFLDEVEVRGLLWSGGGASLREC